jgi:hypothetical protein
MLATSICSAFPRNTDLALDKLRLDVRPCLTLSSITEQVHDDCTLADGLVDVEEVLAGDPAVLFCLFPACTILAHADNHIKAIVAEVETLTVALGTVADEGKGVVFEVLL